jgi:hypothetical protein
LKGNNDQRREIIEIKKDITLLASELKTKHGFFGEMSRFQILVAIVTALLTIATILLSGYTIYKNFIERAKVAVFPGDAVRIIFFVPQNPQQMNLMLNLVNKGTKPGIVHRMELIITDPTGQLFHLSWNLFYEYLPGGEHVRKSSDVYPVAVPPKNNYLLLAGFQSESSGPIPWRLGQYKLQVLGWVNKRHRAERSNINEEFHININNDQLGVIQALQQQRIIQLHNGQLLLFPLDQPRYTTISVLEWERPHQ